MTAALQATPGLALSVCGLTQRFGGVTALRTITLDVAAGSRHAVIGPNGAGKSTLFRVICGEYPPSEGVIRLDGRALNGLSPDRVAALGVARSFQTSSLFPQMSVLHNVVLAVLAHLPARRDLWRPLKAHTQARERAAAVLERMGLLAQADVLAGSLPHGQKRQLELAMVLAQAPRLLLLDEPLAGLSAPERQHVTRLLLGLPRELTTVLTEHDLPFCLEFADRVTVLSGGGHLLTGTPAEVRASEAVQAVYVGQALDAGRVSERQGGEVGARIGAQNGSSPPLLDVSDLSAGYGSAQALAGVSLSVRPGEVVAVLGRNGAGKTTLLTTLMGWRSPTGGTVTLGGQPVTGLAPAALSARGLALVPQGRRMLTGLSVDEELRLAARPGRWMLAGVYGTFPRLLERRRSLSTTLSGGEQQTLALGRALLQNPRLLLLDEPTEGLSPLMVGVLKGVLKGLRESGETVLLAEQNLDLALAVADRVYVLDHGAVIHSGDAAQLAGDRALLRKLMGV